MRNFLQQDMEQKRRNAIKDRREVCYDSEGLRKLNLNLWRKDARRDMVVITKTVKRVRRGAAKSEDVIFWDITNDNYERETGEGG